MLKSEQISEPIPLGIAILIAGFMYGVSIYAFLTCFHPAWKRPLHWGRMRRGPRLSRWSHIMVGVWSVVTPWAVVGPSFGIRGVAATVCNGAAAVVTAATLGGMIYDCLLHWQR